MLTKKLNKIPTYMQQKMNIILKSLLTFEIATNEDQQKMLQTKK